MDLAESADCLSLDEVAAQLRSLTSSGWMRLRAMARLGAQGLQGWKSDDLLNEALTKLCEGTRAWRRGTHMLVTVKVLMHSIASNERKKNKTGPIDWNVVIDAVQAGASHDDSLGESFSDGLTPEHFADGRMQMEYLGRLVCGDPDARMLLMRLLYGHSGAEVAAEFEWDAKRIDAVRKRLATRLRPLKNLRTTA